MTAQEIGLKPGWISVYTYLYLFYLINNIHVYLNMNEYKLDIESMDVNIYISWIIKFYDNRTKDL